MNFTDYVLTINAQLTFLLIKSTLPMTDHPTKVECLKEATDLIDDLMEQIKKKESYDAQSQTADEVIPNISENFKTKPQKSIRDRLLKF